MAPIEPGRRRSPRRSARAWASPSSSCSSWCCSSRGGYVAAYAVAGDKVPRGTTVAGVADRRQDPRRGASRRSRPGWPSGPTSSCSSPSAATAARSRRSELGLSVDYAASVSEAGGERTWDPQRLWDYYTGGEDLDPVVDARRGEARGRARRPRRGVRHRKAKNGAISFDTGRAVVTEPEVGQALDREGVAEALLGRVARRRRAGDGGPRARRHRPRHRRRRRPGGDGHLRQPGAVGSGDAGLRRLAGPAVPARLRAGARA